MLSLSKSLHRTLLAGAVIIMPLALTACGSNENDKKAVAQLDEKLIGKTSDPEMNVAVEDRILVDPELTQNANTNAVKAAPAPLSGSVPPDSGYDGAAASRDELKAAGNLNAPAPREMSGNSTQRGVTLGALAEQQAAAENMVRRANGGGGCGDISYGASWADRLPAPFGLFPRARLVEAGGLESANCNIRAASFTTASPMQEVVDYYYNRARSAGFSAEYKTNNGENILGGTRAKDNGAYYILFSRHAGGGTAVDIVANNGR
jgi:ribosomal protein L34